MRQSLGDAPLQVEQALSQGKQRPSSVPSASWFVSYVPAGHSLTQVLSGKKQGYITSLVHTHALFLFLIKKINSNDNTGSYLLRFRID